MGYLTRDSILTADDLKTVEVEVSEWGGTVVLKMLSGKERDEFETSIVSYSGGRQNVSTKNVRAKLVQKTAIDPETKQLLFSVADIEALGEKSAAALERVFNAAQILNRFTDGDIDELAKN